MSESEFSFLFTPPATPATPAIPATPGTPAEPSISEIDPPEIHNIVSTINLGCKLDLKKIAMCAGNVEYNPRRYNVLIMRIRSPKTTALIYHTGKLVCIGAKTEEDSLLAARKHARKLEKLGFKVKVLNFKIVNMVGVCNVGFPIRLEKLVISFGDICRYEPELFAALIFRMLEPRIMLLIFVTGKIVFTGAHSRQEIRKALDRIYPILKQNRKAVLAM